MFEDAVIINAFLNIGLIGLIFYLDRHERESVLALARVFFLSIMATFVLSFFKLLLVGEREFSPFVQAYVEAGVLEELVKFALLAWVMGRLKEIDEPFDLVVYMATIALGFAFFENINYYVRITGPGTLWRALTSDATLYHRELLTAIGVRLTPVHLLIDLAAILVIGGGERVRWKRIPAAYVGAAVLHGTWNILADSLWIVPYTFVLTVLAAVAVARLSAGSLFSRKCDACEALVDKNSFLLKHAEGPFVPDEKNAALEALKRIRSGLAQVRYLGGREQRTFYRFFRETFPSPLVGPDGPGLTEGIEKLDRLVRRLEPVREARTDWSYYAGLVIALVFAAALALGLAIGFSYLI